MKIASKHRYLAVLPRAEGSVFLSWRLLPGDPPDAPFQVERRRHGRDWERVAPAPLTASTSFLDQPPEPMIYTYRIVDGDGAPSETVDIRAGAEPTIAVVDAPLNPEDHYDTAIVGDLTGDGRLGYVLRAARGGTVWLVACRHDGEFLWELDTCLPASGGWDGSTLHVPFLCWDLDGDGRDEIALGAVP